MGPVYESIGGGAGGREHPPQHMLLRGTSDDVRCPDRERRKAPTVVRAPSAVMLLLDDDLRVCDLHDEVLRHVVQVVLDRGLHSTGRDQSGLRREWGDVRCRESVLLLALTKDVIHDLPLLATELHRFAVNREHDVLALVHRGLLDDLLCRLGFDLWCLGLHNRLCGLGVLWGLGGLVENCAVGLYGLDGLSVHCDSPCLVEVASINHEYIVSWIDLVVNKIMSMSIIYFA